MTGTALAQPPGGGDKRQAMRRGYADPSLIIAAELAFNRVAAEKGQWTALARIMAKDAVLFRPEPVFAERWLKGRRDPSVPVRLRTQQVLMACDGSFAVSTGLWARGTDGASGGDRGWFTNIWRRDKKGYRLILSHDRSESTAAQAARSEDDLEAITARIATCPRRLSATGVQSPDPVRAAAAPLDPRQPLPMEWEDRSGDGTLRWRWSVTPGGARVVQVWMATDEGEALLLTDRTDIATR